MRNGSARALAAGLTAMIAIATLSYAFANDMGRHEDSDARNRGGKSVRVAPLFGLDDPSEGPFPSDFFTVRDESQNTCERVNLPKPDCGAAPFECVELDLVNELDGFNVRPRLVVPFNGPIDLRTVSSNTIFLVTLQDSLRDGVPACLAGEDEEREGDDADRVPGGDRVVGIDRVVWDPETFTLYAEAEERLAQHTTYALIVTRSIRDERGHRIERAESFEEFRRDGDSRQNNGRIAASGYRRALERALRAARRTGIDNGDIAAASVFTTHSVTSELRKLHDQISAAAPTPADFRTLPGGGRGIFSLDQITNITHNRQTRTTGPLTPVSLAGQLPLLRFVPGAISQLAFGKFKSDYYLRADATLAPLATFSGTPEPLERDIEVHFNVTIPSGPKPAAGWPIVVFGHGSPDNNTGVNWAMASSLAARGMATITINLPGHGFGPASTLTLARSAANGGNVTFLSGGRARDVDGNGTFGNPEGWAALPPKTILQAHHGQKQGMVDYARLVRVIEAGIDFDGDGTVDFDANQIYFQGFSAGGATGIMLTIVEPQLRATAVNGVGTTNVPWNNPLSRAAVGNFLTNRVPSLINPAGATVKTTLGGIALNPPFFNENLPARGSPVLVNTVPGAIAIQNEFERVRWVAKNDFAPFLRTTPLEGVPARPLLILMARGDQTVNNPNTTELAREGRLEDRTVMYRHDLLPGRAQFKNPHAFIFSQGTAVMVEVARAAQNQIATFFASDGAEVIDPDGAGVLFEVPAATLPGDFDFGYTL